MQKKQIAAMVLVPAAILAIAATWRMSQGPSARQDKANLQKQMTAQGRMGGPGGMPGNFDPKRMQAQMLDRMGKELALTDAQKQKVASLQDAQMPKMQQIMQDNSLTMDQQRSKMDQARKDQEMQIKAVLTSEQQTKYDEMQKRMRERMQQMRAAMGNGNGPMGGPPPDGGMGGPPQDGMMGGPPPGNAPGNGQGQGGN
jgi:protein CpxP